MTEDVEIIQLRKALLEALELQEHLERRCSSLESTNRLLESKLRSIGELL